MPDEVEAKYAVPNLAVVRRALHSAGAMYQGTVLQTDRFYDLPGQVNRKKGCALRLRSVRIVRRGAETSNARPLLTFKGPVRPHAKVKIRQELQTGLDDADQARQLLLACGFKQTACFQKRRSRYSLGRCRVELDQLPLLGSFVEIEGPHAGAIETLRRRLGIEAEHIAESYIHLLRRECRRRKRPAKEILFS